MSRRFRPRANTAVTTTPAAGRAPAVEWIGCTQHMRDTFPSAGANLAHQVTATIPADAPRELGCAREWVARWDADGAQPPAYEAMVAYRDALADQIDLRGEMAWFQHYDS